MKTMIIGSRASRLALRQTQAVQRAIQKRHPEIKIDVQVIRTTGDKMSRTALSQLTGSVKGLFVKEIELALREGRIDLAVHSLKDLPIQLPEGLCLGPIPEREDPRDVLVSKSKIHSLTQLPPGAHLGTGSLRRRLQLHVLRPDLLITPIRGNVDTRIRKIGSHNLEGVVVAAAGLKRLDLADKISYPFPVDEMIPAVGQGALALEIRTRDSRIRDIVGPLNHPATRSCVLAERKFLEAMGGGCQVPIGAHAWTENGKGTFSACVGDPSQLTLLRKTCRGDAHDLEDLALGAAHDLLSRGAAEILKELNIRNTG